MKYKGAFTGRRVFSGRKPLHDTVDVVTLTPFHLSCVKKIVIIIKTQTEIGKIK